MTFEEVLLALRKGKKIRRESWGNKQLYYYVDFNGEKDKLKSSFDIYREVELNYLELTATDWEIYQEPLLTDDEKEFIKGVLKFMNNKKIELIKIEYDELICLYSLCFENEGNIVKCRFCFNDRKLFNNLKLNYYYTLKELGLDEQN